MIACACTCARARACVRGTHVAARQEGEQGACPRRPSPEAALGPLEALLLGRCRDNFPALRRRSRAARHRSGARCASLRRGKRQRRAARSSPCNGPRACAHESRDNLRRLLRTDRQGGEAEYAAALEQLVVPAAEVCGSDATLHHALITANPKFDGPDKRTLVLACATACWSR
jgi:hypothetical protein